MYYAEYVVLKYKSGHAFVNNVRYKIMMRKKEGGGTNFNQVLWFNLLKCT